MNQKERIIALSNAFGPSGLEDEVVEIVKKDLPSSYEAKEDTLRNLYLFPHQKKKEGYTILLDAHSDEVGFIVQSILSNGTIRFLPLGGWDPVNVAGSAVEILGEQGKVSGIVVAKPVHFMSEEEKKKPIDLDSMRIDVGTSSKEETLSLGIDVGCFIVPATKCLYNEQLEIFQGKAFDCRIGCAALLQTLHEIDQESFLGNAIGVLSAQEEVGDRGSECVAKTIRADVAICFEGCPADDSFESPDCIQTAMKKGVMLRAYDRSMITHPGFQKFALNCAKENNIPYQVAVRKGGGTNGGVYHLHNIPTIVLGIPTRFAHNGTCFCAYQDYRNAVDLAKAIIQSLSPEILSSF